MIIISIIVVIIPYLLETIPHPKLSKFNLLRRTAPYMYALRCMQYVFASCNPMLTVSYGQILDRFGINFIPQGTMELILRDDFEQVR